MLEKVSRPSEPGFIVRASPVAGVVSVTRAPVTTAPCGSVTRPVRMAVGNCAQVNTHKEKRKSERGNSRRMFCLQDDKLLARGQGLHCVATHRQRCTFWDDACYKKPGNK